MARRQTDSPLLFSLSDGPDYSSEAALASKGFNAIAGVDEAGRGPLAGPVVAAAVILDAGAIPDGLNDSKKLSEKSRDRLFDIILRQARAVSVSSLCAQSIDGSDIRKASLEAMRRSVNGLVVVADHVLADGCDIPPGLHCKAQALIKGDGRSVSIAAASIVAKVMRDRMMKRVCPALPAYGFSSHKGYGSLLHRTAIQEHGPVERLHRFSFAPIRQG